MDPIIEKVLVCSIWIFSIGALVAIVAASIIERWFE